MALNITIKDIPLEDINQAVEFNREWLSSTNPSMDTSPGGVFDQLLVLPQAQLAAAVLRELVKVQNAQSIINVERDPLLSNTSVVDQVFSNYRVTRRTGQAATGKISVIIANLLTTQVVQGTRFRANGLEFVTPVPFVGVTQASSISNPAQQRLITKRPDNTYSFVIDVVAVEAGEAYQVRRGTRFTVEPSPSGLVDAFAFDDFGGGVNTESNAQIVARFREGISPNVYSGRTHIIASQRKAYPTFRAISIIGFGDSEMIRDRHNIFAASHGGKADIWVRTQTNPTSKTFVLPAQLIDPVARLWQLTVDRDVYPGFYEVESILPVNSSGAGSLEFVSETRGFNLTAGFGEFVPSIKTGIEAAYSRYQTSIIRFKAPDTPISPTNQSFSVRILGVAGIKELQTAANDFNNRNPQADYLVRAPVPAFCKVSLVVQYAVNAEMPDAYKIKKEIVERVESIHYSIGKLPVSVILDAVHNASPGPGIAVVTPIDIIVSIRKPDGEYLRYRSSSDIVVPNLPLEQVTSRTVIFYMTQDDIDLRIEQAPALPV